MNKIRSIFTTILTIMLSAIMIFMIDKGAIKVENESKYAIWAIIIGLPILSIFSSIKTNKRINDMKKIANITKEQQRKLKETKRKYRNKKLHKFMFCFIISMLGLTIIVPYASMHINNIFILLVVIFMPAIVIVMTLIRYVNEDDWYYNLDEFLFLKYQLIESANKKEKIKELKKRINDLKEELRQKRKTKQLEKTLVQPEEKQIRDINMQLNEVKRMNEYTKTLDDGTEIKFVFEIVLARISQKSRYYYNVECSLLNEKIKLVSKNELNKILDNYQHLHINVSETGKIETKFIRTISKPTYDLLALMICYSYEACIEFVNYMLNMEE